MQTRRSRVISVRPRQEREASPPADAQQVAVNLAAMTRLHELGMRLARAGDFSDLLTHLLDAAIELTQADNGYIQFIEVPAGETRLAVQRGLAERLAERLADSSLTALRENRHSVIADVLREPLLNGSADLDLLLANDIRALATVPLATRGGKLLGILSIQFSAPHGLSEDEVRFLDLAAGMAADFIERRQAEQALRLSEERFRAIVNAGAQVFFRMSADWTEMSELSGGGFLGDNLRPNVDWLRDHVHPEVRNRMREKIEEVTVSGATFELDHRIRGVDGRVRWVHTRVVPLRDVSGTVREWFGAATDITERKEADEKLQFYQNQLEELVMERTSELDAVNGVLRDEIIERGREHRAHEKVLRQLADAQEAERRRISRQLHDEVGQQLAALLLGINELAERYRVPWQADELRQIQAIAQTIATEIHDLAVELRPTSLDDLGLARALAAYAELWSEKTGVNVDFHAGGFESRRVPGPVETAAYRIVQEALTNVKKHAQATTVSLIVELKEHELSAIVEDDGVGFDSGLQRSVERLGVLGMTERAALVGGELRVESSVGAGTTVVLRVPV